MSTRDALATFVAALALAAASQRRQRQQLLATIMLMGVNRALACE